MENNHLENNHPENNQLLKSQGLTYTQKSKKLEDAKSSSWLFIIFGAAGLCLLLAMWLGILPLPLAFYMKVLYTAVLGTLFAVLTIVGIYYTKRVKVLEQETSTEEQQSEEIISWITTTYPLETLDQMISARELSMEQLYFERYEKLGILIREKYQISDHAYLDYLIEKIYQIYSPEE